LTASQNVELVALGIQAIVFFVCAVTSDTSVLAPSAPKSAAAVSLAASPVNREWLTRFLLLLQRVEPDPSACAETA
jgi:hypothetical protein